MGVVPIRILRQALAIVVSIAVLSACTFNPDFTAAGYVPCNARGGCDDDAECTCIAGQVCVPKDAGEDPGICFGCPTACDDQNPCNGVETCVRGQCQAGTPPSCDDGVACTIDSCDRASGGCVHKVDQGRCQGPRQFCVEQQGCVEIHCVTVDDCPGVSLCLGRSFCDSGTCSREPPPDCSENNPCTVDSCDPVQGCRHTQVQDGTPCGGDGCLTSKVCEAGTCSPAATPAACASGDRCLDAVCVPGQGCLTFFNHAACDDGDSTTILDRCSDGQCTGQPAFEICGNLVDEDGDQVIDNGCPVTPIGTYVSSSTGRNYFPGTQSQPVQTITQGIINAQAIYHYNSHHQPVYVAAGTYTELVEMQDGVDVLGGYNPDDWEAPPDPAKYPTVILAPDFSSAAVVFASSEPMVFSGFQVHANQYASSGSAAVDISSACAPILMDNRIEGNQPDVAVGVKIEGGTPVLERNQIIGTQLGPAKTAIGVMVSNAAPLLQNNDIEGFTGTDSVEAIGLELMSNANGTQVQYNRIQGSTMPGDGRDRSVGIQIDSTNGPMTIQFNPIIHGGESLGSMSSAGVESVGIDVNGTSLCSIAVEYNGEILGGEAIRSDAPGAVAAGIRVTACKWPGQILVSGNTSVQGGSSEAQFSAAAYGLLAYSGSNMEVDHNSLILGAKVQAADAYGIACVDDQTTCTITKNAGPILGSALDAASVQNATGIFYSATPGAKVTNNANVLGGAATELHGLALDSLLQPAVLDGNQVWAGSCMVGSPSVGAGIIMRASPAVITNNIVFGGDCDVSAALWHIVGPTNNGLPITVSFNELNGGGSASGSGSYGVYLVDPIGFQPPQGYFLNNIIHGGFSPIRFGMFEDSYGVLGPSMLAHNDFIAAGGGYYYLWTSNVNGAPIDRLEDLNTLFTGGLPDSGNIAVDPHQVNPVRGGDFHLGPNSLCIDAGLGRGSSGVPNWPDLDMDGQPRIQGVAPDIGPDEVR